MKHVPTTTLPAERVLRFAGQPMVITRLRLIAPPYLGGGEQEIDVVVPVDDYWEMQARRARGT